MDASKLAANSARSKLGAPIRDGVMRTRTTVRLFPEEEQFFRDRGKELGLTLSDTLAYYLALGSGRDIQPAIKRKLAERNATAPREEASRLEPRTDEPTTDIGPVTWALKTHITNSTNKLLLVALASLSNDQGEASPKVATLMEMASTGRRTVFRALKELEDAGLITRIHGYRTGANGGGRRQVNSVYKLAIPETVLRRKAESRTNHA